MNDFRCYEEKIEESEKPVVAKSQTQDSSGLSRQCSATEHNSQTTINPHNPLYIYCTGGTEYLSSTPAMAATQYVATIVRDLWVECVTC